MPNPTNSHTFSGGVDVRQYEHYHIIIIPYKFISKVTFSKQQVELRTNSIVNELDHLPNKDIIVLLNVEEESGMDAEENMIYWCDFLTSHLNSRPSMNYVILTNETFTHAHKYSKVLSVNWFLLQTVSMYSQTEIIPWEPTNTDILFLPGKPWKPSRLPALYYFLRSSIRHNLKYSSLTYEDMYSWHGEAGAQRLIECWHLVYNDPSAHINVIKEIMNGIAKSYDMPWRDREHGPGDFNFLHPKMYSNIGAEIIAETAHNNDRFITEKTYKSIVLGYPFVFIHNNFLRKILKQGFKIYQPVLEEPSEGHNGQRDWINEFETCVKNTEKVVNNTQEEILKDTIKWNQEHAMILYQETINNIAKIIPNFYNYAGEIFCKTVKLQEENT